MLETFIEETKRLGIAPLGMEVRKNGNVVWAGGTAPEKRYPVYSATKSFTSAAVGLAVSKGRMNLEDTLEKYFPEELGRAPQESAAYWKDITISRLLTMTVPGLPFRPEGPDWLQFCFSRGSEDMKEKTFWYSNIPAYLAGTRGRRKSGRLSGQERIQTTWYPAPGHAVLSRRPFLRSDGNAAYGT